MAAKGSEIAHNITKQWNDGETMKLETELVVTKVAHAILNFSKNCNVLYYWRFNHV